MLRGVGGLSLSIRWMVDSARRPGSNRMAAWSCLLDDAGGFRHAQQYEASPRGSPLLGDQNRGAVFLSFSSRAYTLGVSPACLSREFSGQAGLPPFSEANGQAPDGSIFLARPAGMPSSRGK